MELEALQQALLEAVAPGGTPPAMLQGLIQGARPADSADPGLAVYRRNGAGARVNALVQVYPVCAAVLGEPCLRGLAGRWVTRFPSRTRDLERDSAGFPAWLAAATRGSRAFRDLPYLGDLARLEWLWHAATLAPPAPTFDSGGFAGLTPRQAARTRLQRRPGLGLLVTPWPVRAIHQAHRAGAPTREVPALPTREYLVAWLAGRAPRVQAVSPGHGAALAACGEGRTLATVASRCARAGGDPGAIVADLVRQGWVSGFAPPGPRR